MSALAGVMAVVLVAGVVSALSLRNRGDVQELTVADAVTSTQAAGSARMTMRLVVTRSSQALLPPGELMTLSGAIDFRHVRYTMKGTFNREPMELRGIGNDQWSRVELPAAFAAAGSTPAKPWIHTTRVAPKAALDDISKIDPSTLLDLLTSKGTTVSSSSSGDRTRTVLRLPADAFGGTFGSPRSGQSLDVTVESDASRRIRLMTFASDVPDLVSMSVSVAYDDFGVVVDVVPPPADQVKESTAVTAGSSSSQTFSSTTGSSPADRKKVCAEITAVRDRMPTPQTAQQKAQRRLFDETLARICAS
jgi:hypothetical protein